MENVTTNEYLSPKCRWIYSPVDKALRGKLAEEYSLHEALAEVLIKRGLTSSGVINDYFDTPLNGLINPFLMKDMQKGVARICKALKNKELICIYGDYDVDGITSTSLMYLFLACLGGNVTYYIPNRLEEGYGLNIEAINELSGKHVGLLITVDCGISAVDEVVEANRLGMDVIVTDHHQPAEELPEAVAVINPMREDDTYPFKMLSGVGVAFKVCMALRYTLREDPEWTQELPNLKQYLDIVALGTIADVVPLTGENRIFVVHGLKLLTSPYVRAGIDELKKVAGINRQQLSTSHVGFNLAPRINAVGRLGNSNRGFKLLTTTNRREAHSLAMELDQENRYRQDIERDILNDVFAHIEEHLLYEKHKGLVVYSRNWHPGVLGIVASRVADRYFRPTIVLAEEQGLLKGSARSIPSFHLYDGLKTLSDILVSFGGHKYAAGLKINIQDIKELQSRFDTVVTETLQERDFIPEIYIDAFIDSCDINEKFMDSLLRFEPYGNSNKEAVFCMLGVEKYQNVAFVGKDENHAKCVFVKDGVVMDAIGYNMRMYKDLLFNSSKFDIIFTLSYNNYSRHKMPQLVLKDLKIHGQ